MAIIQTIPLGKKYGSMTSSEAQAGTNTESQLISAKVLNDQIDEKISDIGLATVATSGSYNDLSDKPTIPTIPAVNNGTLTIQKNGTTVKTFTANSSSNVTADITVPTKVSELTNDSGYITGVSWNNVSGKPSTFTPKAHTHAKSDITDFPTLATVATSGSYTDLSNKPTIPVIDSTLNATSTNGLQNKVIKTALDGKANSSHTHTKSQITDFPTLATVATSGSYNDLSNKPTIPTVNNATLTIQKNGSNVQTFTANASSNVTANITVPTKTSQLSNDTNYATTTNVANSLQEAKNYVDTATGNMVTTDTTQTIPGNKAFSGFLDYLVPIKLSDIPTANTYKHFRFLDKDGLRLFSLQYCSRPNGARDAISYVYDKDGGSHGLQVSTDNCVIPTMRDTVSLGTSGTKWLSVYATNFYGDYGSFSNKVEAPLVRATADLGLVLAKKDSKAPTTTSGWNQIQFYDKNLVQLGYFQLSSDTNANVYNWVGRKNADLTKWRKIFWNVETDVFGCDTSNTVSLGSSASKWSQLHCTEITTSTQNFLRNIYGDYGTFWRQDGRDLYLLLTAKGDQTGNWTSARPIVVSLSTGVCNINGNAATANKITLTDTNPTSGTTYQIPFALSTDDTDQRVNDGLRDYTLRGTTSVSGYGRIYLGNSIANGVAGNKYGSIGIYSKSGNYAVITGETTLTNNRILTIPNDSGTLICTGNLTSNLTTTLGSGISGGGLSSASIGIGSLILGYVSRNDMAAASTIAQSNSFLNIRGSAVKLSSFSSATSDTGFVINQSTTTLPGTWRFLGHSDLRASVLGTMGLFIRIA